MRIGIDARFYGPFGKGLGRYVQKLLEHLEGLDHHHEFRVLLRKENWDAYTPRDRRFTKVLADFPWYSLKEQWQFPRLLNTLPVDLMHFPHYNVPLIYRRPFVVTIHDLIVSRYPTVRATTLNPVLYRLKHAAYQAVIRSAVRRAKKILTVSNYSKKILASTFAIPDDRVVVTYEAADPVFSGSPRRALTEKWLAGQPYILYVGNAYPHKNLEGLLAAFKQLREMLPNAPRLVLVGKIDYFYQRIVDFASSLGLREAVLFPGYVSDEELAALYAHAAVYAFPSFEEGFGLPPLEAMASGVPVVSSDQSCLPEILGDAAAYANPRSPHEITKALHTVLTQPEYRKALIARGYERIKMFRWDDLARRTLDVYTTKV